MSWVAVGSLAALLLSMTAYSYDPLPGSWAGTNWQTPGLWLSMTILAIGLVCFVVCLISGLITILNWGVDRPRDRSGDH
jgi:uncharacterized membrane protein